MPEIISIIIKILVPLRIFVRINNNPAAIEMKSRVNVVGDTIEGKQFYKIINSESVDTEEDKEAFWGGDTGECKDGEDGKSICKEFEIVKNSGTVIMFAYGTSGSGKTWFLRGGADGSNKESIVKLMFDYFESQTDTYECSLHKIKEIGITSTVEEIDYGEIKIGKKEDAVLEYNQQQQSGENKYDTFNSANEHIQQYKAHIEKMPLNPNSSRSHLLIIFKVQKTVDGPNQPKPGYVLIVDFPGAEVFGNYASTYTTAEGAKLEVYKTKDRYGNYGQFFHNNLLGRSGFSQKPKLNSVQSVDAKNNTLNKQITDGLKTLDNALKTTVTKVTDPEIYGVQGGRQSRFKCTGSRKSMPRKFSLAELINKGGYDRRPSEWFRLNQYPPYPKLSNGSFLKGKWFLNNLPQDGMDFIYSAPLTEQTVDLCAQTNLTNYTDGGYMYHFFDLSNTIEYKDTITKVASSEKGILGSIKDNITKICDNTMAFGMYERYLQSIFINVSLASVQFYLGQIISGNVEYKFSEHMQAINRKTRLTGMQTIIAKSIMLDHKMVPTFEQQTEFASVIGNGENKVWEKVKEYNTGKYLEFVYFYEKLESIISNFAKYWDECLEEILFYYDDGNTQRPRKVSFLMFCTIWPSILEVSSVPDYYNVASSLKYAHDITKEADTERITTPYKSIKTVGKNLEYEKT